MQTKAYIIFAYIYCVEVSLKIAKKRRWEEVTTISTTNEIGKAICQVLAEISHREKTKAVEGGEYGDAVVATILEELFKQAESRFS